jgi:low affinity Fe/Cu permease
MPRKKIVMNTHARAHIHLPTSLSDRIADRITSFVGSWWFVGIHAVWFLVWILLHLEPFPFGLLTLMVSLEAIFLSTFVMMSQNRSGAKDHIRDDHEAKEVDELFTIQLEQVKILNVQTEILNLLRAQAKPSDPAEATTDTGVTQPMQRVRRRS